MPTRKTGRRRPTTSGRILNQKWGVGAQHALYRETGNWYMPLERFPGALFDAHGYVLFATEQEYKDCQYLHKGPRITVRDAIVSIPMHRHGGARPHGYVRVKNPT